MATRRRPRQTITAMAESRTPTFRETDVIPGLSREDVVVPRTVDGS